MVTTQASPRLQPVIKTILALSPYEQLQVIMILLQTLFGLSQPKPAKPSLVTTIGTARGGFATPTEVDNFIRAERESWTF